MAEIWIPALLIIYGTYLSGYSRIDWKAGWLHEKYRVSWGLVFIGAGTLVGALFATVNSLN